MKKYLVITGGQLYNKGAQAMVFISAHELHKRFPDGEIVLLSKLDVRRTEEDRKQYQFHIKGYPKSWELLYMQTGLGRFFLTRFGSASAKEYLKLMEQTQMVVDVSGYALGSDWGYKRSLFYLTRIQIAKAFQVPVYLMPQSFGPFAYEGIFSGWMKRKIGHVLKYPKVVMCREHDGYQLLHEEMGLSNVILTSDLVLQNREVDPTYVYKKLPEYSTWQTPKHCVAVIPNQKTTRYVDISALENLYKKIVCALLEKERSVFLCYHSAEDRKLCERIKTNFPEDNRVILQEKELSCLEFDRMVKQVDFIVASRYHAIVHAYRNCVPAIVLGWAKKYQELLNSFSQGQFAFDVRSDLDEEKILQSVSDMSENFSDYVAMIRKPLEQIQCSNVYDYLSK